MGRGFVTSERGTEQMVRLPSINPFSRNARRARGLFVRRGAQADLERQTTCTRQGRLADSFYAVPSEIDDKQKAAWIQSTAHALAAVVHTDPEDAQTSEEQIAARLDAGHSFAWVARRVTPEVAARVQAL